MSRTGNNVRLTEQAHIVLSEKAENLNVSMKEIASEAIFVLAKKEDREKEQREHIEIFEKRVAILSKRIRDNKFFALGTFLLGAVIGGALTFVILVGIIL